MEVSESDCVFLHTNVCMYVCMYVWMDGWMDGWILVCIYGCMDGWMDGWMDGYSLWIRSPSGGLIQAPPLLTGEGTVLPTRMHLTPPGHTANRAPQAASSPVCTNPACSTNQQAWGKQATVSPLPQGEQPTRGDTKTCGVFVYQSP